jgi:hypothetical protein
MGRAFAQAPSAPAKRPSGREEEARRKLLEQVGLEKRETAPAMPAAAPAKPEPPPSATAPGAAGVVSPSPSPAASPSRPPPILFAGRVHELLLASCRPCHAAGGMAAATRLRLDGNVVHDFASVRPLVDPARPKTSLLLDKGAGNLHGGGPTLPAGGENHRRLLQWIAAGAAGVSVADDSLIARGPAAAAAATARAGVSRPRAIPRPAATPLPLAAPVPLVLPAPGAPVATGERSADPAAPAASSTAPAGDGTGNGAAPTAADPPSEPAPLPATALDLHAQMIRACVPCHRPGGPGAMSRYKLAGDPRADLVASQAFLDADAAHSNENLLAKKASGQSHGGGPVWPAGSPGHTALLAWIVAGAPAAAAPAVVEALAAPASPATPAPPVAAPAAPAAAAAPARSPAQHGGLALTDTLMLNGRFDLNLERRDFRGNPWAEGSKTALQSYHHFVFLSRSTTEDPFVFTAEITSLQFFEAGVRLGPRQRPWQLHLKAGKLLVPFGNEPLYHQNYGGQAGFDQRVLPPIWAAEGLAAAASITCARFVLTADLYGVRGYALRRADAVLNLQSDVSPIDDVKPAYGLRLGAAAGPLTGYYSALFNPLGLGRRLFMQAIDVTLWRWRRVAVLDRLVLGAGFLRADIGGGGSGLDDYHFASYWLGRVYATDWLYAQYRQGLRTFDNKRNLTYDARRATAQDGSGHNLSLVARHHGLSVALSYFINLEKADEIDDDLLRLAVAFEF